MAGVKRTPPPVTLAALVATIVLAAACGGGQQRLSRAEFIAKADPICRTAVEEIRAIPHPTSPQEGVAAQQQFKGAIDGMLANLRRLQPPKDDEPALDEMYATIEQIVSLSDQALTAANDRAEFARIETESTQLETDVAASAKAYGFAVCGIEH